MPRHRPAASLRGVSGDGEVSVVHERVELVGHDLLGALVQIQLVALGARHVLRMGARKAHALRLELLTVVLDDLTHGPRVQVEGDVGTVGTAEHGTRGRRREARRCRTHARLPTDCPLREALARAHRPARATVVAAVTAVAGRWRIFAIARGGRVTVGLVARGRDAYGFGDLAARHQHRFGAGRAAAAPIATRALATLGPTGSDLLGTERTALLRVCGHDQTEAREQDDHGDPIHGSSLVLALSRRDVA